MTIHSMTAFARETGGELGTAIVELRSVNHRYLDCHFKLPDSLRALEPRLREALSAALKRGKVDCQIRISGDATGASLAVDESRLSAVVEALRSVSRAAPELAPPDTLSLLQFPGVCRGGEDHEKTLQALALDVFARALENLRETRAREGRQLTDFLQRRLQTMRDELSRVRDELPELRSRQEERLRRRLAELDLSVDEGRIEQELVMAAQKSDVDEELDRLEAHIEEVGRVLAEGGPCGRRLDFLMQELNREANTLSSKSIASSTTQSSVELKVIIEQMREQVQNIE